MNGNFQIETHDQILFYFFFFTVAINCFLWKLVILLFDQTKIFDIHFFFLHKNFTFFIIASILYAFETKMNLDNFFFSTLETLHSIRYKFSSLFIFHQKFEIIPLVDIFNIIFFCFNFSAHAFRYFYVVHPLKIEDLLFFIKKQQKKPFGKNLNIFFNAFITFLYTEDYIFGNLCTVDFM
jgi:hypothetical protein